MIHDKLDAWKSSIELVKQVYRATNEIPRHERFGLTSQLRRAVVSVPSNIAEGSARSSDKEFIHYLYHSLGSIAEVETQLIICEELNYFEVSGKLKNDLLHVRRLILGLIKYLRSKG